MFFVKDFSDSPVNHRRPPVNHRRLAVNHRRLVTKKWFFFIHFLDDSEHSKTNEHLKIFWYFWSDSLVNHRKLAVNHRRLVTKKKKWPSQKKIFFFIHFLDESEPSESKKSSAQFFFFLRKLLTFSTFFLRPKPSTRLNMAYMKFQKKMLGGSDFFLDLDSQIFRNLFDFSPSTPKKAQNFFAAAQPHAAEGGRPPLRTSPP